MNCKQGDLAIIVGTTNFNAGKIVRCLKLLPTARLNIPPGIVETAPNVWLVEPPLMAWTGNLSTLVRDRNLRPIRDPGDDERDEMLRPLPIKRPQTCEENS